MLRVLHVALARHCALAVRVGPFHVGVVHHTLHGVPRHRQFRCGGKVRLRCCGSIRLMRRK
jgi:hypothetical protein